MMYQVTPEQAVAGQPGQLRSAAGQSRSLAGTLGRQSSAIDTAVTATTGIWSGSAGDSYRTKMITQAKPLHGVVDDLTTVAAACETLADRLDAARTAMNSTISGLRARGISDLYAMPALGLGDASDAMYTQAGQATDPGGSVGSGLSVCKTADPGIWVMQYNPMLLGLMMWYRNMSDADLQGVYDAAAGAFRSAINARIDFVRAIGGVRESLAAVLIPDRTPAEVTLDQQVMDGKVNDIGTYLQKLPGKADPQGRLILYRWGHPYRAGALRTENGSDMSNYLMNSPSMQSVVGSQVLPTIAQNLVQQYRNGGNTGTFDYRDNATLPDNGYATGLEQLHGTNMTDGDFHAHGTSTVTPDSYGGYQVTVNSSYAWNDMIDPNGGYPLDTVAAGLYSGKPYDIHINWNASSTMTVDATGQAWVTGGYASSYPTPTAPPRR
jgi:hypothetical protein